MKHEAPPAQAAKATSFRGDINGLRAIAVMSVLAFHFGIRTLSGGFVGVDVFFVISGFLMTGIILGRLEKRTFSVAAFYLDRARRIIPPLAAVCVVLLAAGTRWLLPDEYLILAKHVAGSVLFASNIVYWKESGYFDPEAEGKWLLHTWSLSVEWQFYLLYPLLLILLLKAMRRRRLVVALGGLAAASFALTLWLSHASPRAGFFLLPPRAWEMLVGGLVYLARPLEGRPARAAQLGGLALIALSIFTASALGWPGIWTALPVLGTALVILAARRDSRITGNPVARWVGLCSYSVYLWHWPLAVLLRRSGHVGEAPYVAGAFAVSLALGYLSWRFIEQGLRRKAKAPRIHVAPIRSTTVEHGRYALMVGLVALASAGVWKARGLPKRFSPEVQALMQDTLPGGPYGKGCFSVVKEVPAPCIVGPRHDRAVVAMLGDSHSESSISALVAAVPPDAAAGVGFNGYASCPPLLGARSTDPENKCGAFNARFLPPETQPRTVPLVLVGYWSHYFTTPTILFDGGAATPSAAEFGENIVKTGCALAKAGPTYLLLPTPEFPFEVAHEMQHRLIRDPEAADISIPVATYLDRNRAVLPYFRRAAECGAKLLDPIPYLCPGGICAGTVGHRAIYRDGHHLTEFGNALLTPLFRSIPM